MLFAHLGHYALWDDEAGTALSAKGVLRSLDTGVFVDEHNIVAYRNGKEIRNLRLRYLPPLQAYLAAPFLAVLGEQSAFAARLPFALCGLAGIALMAGWLWRENARPGFAWLLCAGLVCNVSLFLYLRQCRYYAPAWLCSTAIACLYLHWNGRRGGLAGAALLLICLLATNYLNYIALGVCLATDYWLWRRKERRLTPPDWLLLLLPQLIAGAIIVSIWNPLNKPPAVPATSGWLAGKLTLFWWNWRDLNRCEFGALLLLALAPFTYVLSRDRWLLRAPMALFVYVTVVTLCSPQSIESTNAAAVRYLMPVIPLCIAIEALVLCTVTRQATWTMVPLSVLVFGTNLFNGGPLSYCGFRSTIASYLGEMVRPPDDPYTLAAQWINQHVRNAESVLVQPDYATYPLMFHAPKALYAWQLTDPPEPQYAHLPAIHFLGREPPDYLVAFGPSMGTMTNALEHWNGPGVRYEQVALIDHYWLDTYRPELFWRTFKPVTKYDRSREAIYIFKRVAPPIRN